MGRCHGVEYRALVSTCFEMVSRLPEKVLFEKVTSVLGFEGVSQLSWGRKNAFKVKVRKGFNITHRWGRAGPSGRASGPWVSRRMGPKCETGHMDREDITERAYLFHDKDLELS